MNSPVQSSSTPKISASSLLLDQFAQSSPTAKALVDRFRLNRPEVEAHVENMANPTLKAMLVAALFQAYQCPIVLINPDPQHNLRYYKDLVELLPSESIGYYPVEDFSPYDLANLPAQTIKKQYHLSQDLRSGTPKIYLIDVKSLVLKHFTLEALEANAITLKKSQRISPQELANRCLETGYAKTSIILEPGEFSSRGDIFDFYPVNNDPVRIEFFGDTIETIRIIDPDSQRSLKPVDSVFAIPRNPLVLNADNKTQLIKMMQTLSEKQSKTLDSVDAEALMASVANQIQAMEQEFIPDGLNYYAPLLNPEFGTLMDFLPQNGIAVFDDWVVMENNLSGFTDRLDRQWEEGITKGRLLDLEGFRYHLTAEAGLKQLKARMGKRLFLESFPVMDGGQSDVSRYQFEVKAPSAFKANLKEAVTEFEDYRRKQYQIYITTDNPQRVLDNCKEGDVPAVYITEEGLTLEALAKINLDVLVAKKGLLEGFILDECHIVHYTDAELFGRKQKKMVMTATSASKRQDMETIKAIDELREGDYVVHMRHGIGRFVKLATINIDSERREYLTIQYAGNDKIHVPADQVNLLSRYRGSGDKPPKLNKMGGIDWGKTKSKVEKSIQSIARELMELYAARERVRGFTFEPDSPWQVEMEEAFPYTETPDQWQSIMDMKGDMESEKPMDRLICGDVGFGKTEVALRGMFKSVLSGKQVAVLVPTTILAQQHFNTISERFKPYPVRVGLLSRFRSPKEQKEVCDRLAVGECDIVVGTHRLLQKDVHFQNLGLVVIDEEHRFGVSHKEKLKQMRKEIDVLTLSATPIPRTLYMSLSGVRNMSLINTPPINRAPVKTFVGPYNPAQVRMAILKEVDRGGQVYFVHNRVQTIYEKYEELRCLVPEVSIIIGHGQMNERDLENVMLDFSQHQAQVLLCTTIIESGLDIPSANTMIVDRADRFGLAQLYQIRGRVGRSDVQAYCFCYYDQDRILTQDAQERLRAIREFTSLGSGYQIAMRDMEIRGVGNILGAEQHGHMVAVGFDMYCEMLQESIDELQGKITEHKDDSVIDVNVTAFIPTEWVGDKNVKLTEYKRLADIRTERALDIIQAEWKDRFGEIPQETMQLVRMVKLRIRATEMGIPTVREDEEFIKVWVPYTLQQWLQFQAKLPPEIGKKARWVPAVTSKEGSTPILLIKRIMLTDMDVITYLEALFAGMAAHHEAVQAATTKR